MTAPHPLPRIDNCGAVATTGWSPACASGIAHYFHLDPTLVRVGFAVLVIISWGVALVGYLLGWLLIPE